MKLICEGTDLSDAVLKVVKACAAKSTSQILEYIKLSAKNDILSLLATDGEISIEKIIRAEIFEEGEVCVPGKYFADFISKVAQWQVGLNLSGTTLEIEYNGSKSNLQTLPADDFPEIDISISQDHFIMTQRDLKDLIQRTVFCCAQDGSRPILKGCLFEVGGRIVTATALDGYRLATCTRKILSSSAALKIICPAKTLTEIAKMLEDSDDEIKVFVQKGMMLVEIADTILTSKLYTGEFVRKENIIPREFNTRVTVNKAKLEASIERAYVLIRTDANNSIRLDIQGDNIHVESVSDVGRVDENVAAEIDGEELSISMNSKFMLDALKAVKSERAVLRLIGPISPFLVNGENEEDSTYLILPIRTNR